MGHTRNFYLSAHGLLLPRPAHHLPPCILSFDRKFILSIHFLSLWLTITVYQVQTKCHTLANKSPSYLGSLSFVAYFCPRHIEMDESPLFLGLAWATLNIQAAVCNSRVIGDITLPNC